MSGEHHCAATSTVNKKCECEDDLRDSDRLWTDFEHCAQQVSRLYRDPTWKSLQTAAASTTQLYKSSIDVHRRGFEKGFRAGRISLAKEVMTALTSGSAIDLNGLFEMLYANVRMSSTDDGQRMGPPPVVSSDTVAAVHLFQQQASGRLIAQVWAIRWSHTRLLIPDAKNRAVHESICSHNFGSVTQVRGHFRVTYCRMDLAKHFLQRHPHLHRGDPISTPFYPRRCSVTANDSVSDLRHLHLLLSRKCGEYRFAGLHA
ncbi:hypothetical protein Y032_0012g1832 [Ancylostoma ceylanicum]|uniref:Uncharacterized protein n=2 Tax=Ancylostoma ceylanicum TaxID=53326 RepID=A0A016VF15_9BILA|nr:hypothetical protein Y032_0012g1832 [Ancylostoma ceylanicum]